MPKPPHGRAIDRMMATEIGYICIHWGWLEEVLDLLIALLAPIDEQKAWHAITGNLDIRQKAQVLRALFFIKKDWSAEWYELAVETINAIDNDLRPRRNHIVHSSLQNEGKRLLHHKKMVRVSKPQAFQPPELTTLDIKPAKIASARKLQADIHTYFMRCMRIYSFALYPDIFVSRGLSVRRFVHQGEFVARRKRKRSKPKLPLQSPRAKSQ